MKSISFALPLWFLIWMHSEEKLGRMIYHSGYPLYLKSHLALPIGLNGHSFQYAHPIPLDACQVESLILCAPISVCGGQHNIAHQPVVSTFSMHPGLQKKMCVGGEMLNPAESFHFLDQAVCIAGREDQMAGGLNQQRASWDACEGISPFTSQGAWSGQGLELWAGRKCQCQDLCLAHRTLGQIGVGLEAGKRSEDKLYFPAC